MERGVDIVLWTKKEERERGGYISPGNRQKW